jgi:hypothetical protein
LKSILLFFAVSICISSSSLLDTDTRAFPFLGGAMDEDGDSRVCRGIFRIVFIVSQSRKNRSYEVLVRIKAHAP